MRIAFYTLGCKLNQYETKYLEEIAQIKGFITVPFDTEAEIYVINTCTVTAKSDFHARQYIRRAKRTNPSSIIVVTGCYAQRDPENLKDLPEIDLVIGNTEKERLFDYLSGHKGQQRTVVVTSPITGNSDTFYALQKFAGYTRAFMKIQDGCNSACSYCIVPSVRGPSRSLEPEKLVSRFGIFLKSGYKEIVLTGVHIGKYGLDCNPKTNLCTILKKLISINGDFRIRLSSLEPVEISNDLIELFSKSEKLCHHFHIPLQNGNDEILHRMKRLYNVEYYGQLIKRLKEVNPDMCIGADVITGFPGETELHFEDSYNFISSLPLSYLHVFSFSPRPGTEAYNEPGKIPLETIKSRTKRLRNLSIEKNADFRNSLKDKPLQTLIYNQPSNVTDMQMGLSSNYIHMYVNEKTLSVNEFYPLKIKNVQRNMTLAVSHL
ncbi:MAG: tRNA (N(6)-L-threonylcarbamoyladenosine(37)-C(2))-methylthiotransferase MtaB [Candidatus Schekmanbacteria bacterium RBG_13_48_7]|uniref:tRNA (N(6)-L-threonylcarbamoyladenosine(37)-C(2))-methylthiotransferase MtaB n=1 Tax=Candidatus Schekmanbacteria bacterium RBG_13_48_7 TaxID=1817878 RepID=A0A1F7RQN0_9BACT|nr:MAG: tRNA (N(6)-L-threonylcarbamoyladenosine(37)-C(2))-methylthiotransferase MtaB [Candidatus Schekmanbacteria bacterium RBG_13_48_7]